MLLVVQSRIVIYAQDALKLNKRKENWFTTPEWVSKPRAPRTPHSSLDFLIFYVMSLVFLYTFFSLFLCFSIASIEISPFCVAWVFMFIQYSYFSKCFVPYSSNTCHSYWNYNVGAIVNIRSFLYRQISLLSCMRTCCFLRCHMIQMGTNIAETGVCSI